VGSERQRTMRAGHGAASAVVRSLACPALSLRGSARGEKRKTTHDNILQYSHSMKGIVKLGSPRWDDFAWNM
jgi:hypothetical protein